MIVYTLLLVPLDQRLSLGVIYHEALLDGLFVVIGTSTLLSAKYQTLHQLILRYVELNHRCHLVATFVEHLLEGLCLWNGTWESVKDDTLMVSEGVVH